MDQQHHFGLIGKNISYSFSKKFFDAKFEKLKLPNYVYDIYNLDSLQEVEHLLADPKIRGINVTIPYKEKIIPYLDQLSNEAEEIGAVNTVLIKDGIKSGHNTDAFGFEKTLLIHKTAPQQSALILGDGGAAKAVKYILKKHGIPFQTVSRSGKLNFELLSRQQVQENLLIVQCTPVGTFPNTHDCLNFPFSGLTEKHLVIDLIYNPDFTQFLKKAAEMGANTVNGFYMLEQQAEKAWEIWNFKKK